MVNKFTDTMAALISNAFSLSFILFDRLVAYFLEWRVVTDQDAVRDRGKCMVIELSKGIYVQQIIILISLNL